ncbi:ABC transporter ATP-binding protein [Lysobacter sp. 13A]|uniref:ABC transporter ATP-binding protein n=2 Tax=Novilysobacter selenitireducens TaxID=2872639 RepID=A0ABS7T3U8_9GAMM|nr:ABC transporter ATP-binding protein [Lysobacter selenitireducens]
MLELRAIRKAYRMGSETVVALDDVNLQIHRGQSVAFVGSSGAGKSTLLNILGCLDRPDSGSYRLNGRRIDALSENDLALVRNREIGFVFQNFQLLPRVSALHNVAQPLVYRPMKPAERFELARRALARVGLADRGHHLPTQLSGGQRQRVAIARALCGQPSILLADEPTGNLDSKTGEAILRLFDELVADGHTVLMVTHESEVADRCQRVLRLSDGRLVSEKCNGGDLHARVA